MEENKNYVSVKYNDRYEAKKGKYIKVIEKQ